MGFPSRPTQAGSFTSSSIAPKLGVNVSPAGTVAPLPIDREPPKVSVRSANQPVNNFASPQALPHMIHPARGFGVPKVGKV